MKKSYILSMAWFELLRRIEAEREKLSRRPGSEISRARLERYYVEEKELHEMLLEAEKEDLAAM